MWTGKKDTHEYSAQITPYHGYVNAEIIYRDKDNAFNNGHYDSKLRLWLTVSCKRFGSAFRSAPTEKDYQKATAWVERQLNLMDKYSTCALAEPRHLVQYRRMNQTP